MTRNLTHPEEVAVRTDITPAGRASIVEPRTHKEVRTVRRLAVLLAGGALWLLLSASAAFADGGPHQLTVNSGTGGLSGDCAACHRAHTAQAADLLKASMPGLCLTCHNGTGATTDVNNGVQYVPASFTGTPATDPVLGALRGGGFENARIDTSDASRLTYSRAGGVLVTFASAPASGSVVLTWPAIPSMSFAGGSVTIAAPYTTGAIQSSATTLFSTSGVYNTSAQYTSGLPAGGANVIVSSTATTVTFTWHNAWRLLRVPLPSVTNTTGVSATLTDSTTVSATAHVGALATGEATTSTHEGTGTVWGNGPMGLNTAGATGVALECTNCHNPHGNGQYRILNTEPGENWVNGVASGIAGWTAPTNAVEIVDGVALTGSQVRNYTIKPGALATDVTGSASAGDYLRRKYDPSGAANWTNFYLVADAMTIGWNGQSPTNAATVGTASTTLTAGITATVTAAPVASTAGFPTHLPATEPQPLVIVQIDSELMTVSVTTTGSPASGFSATSLKITRGYNGTTAVAHLSGATVAVVTNSALYNNLGRMTAWCITCHTRYNGWAQNGTSSLNAQTPADTMYAFKHGTTGVGCEMCHVSHGTNATMTAEFSSTVTLPGSSVIEDSALLKVNNRGTCNLCHDPTGTVDPGTPTGTVPLLITPGP